MIEDDGKTLWCGNLPDQATEELLYELFLQAGPLEKVRIARDRDGRLKNFAFITFCHEVSVPYAINLFRGTALFHKTLALQSRTRTALLPPPIRCTTLDPSYDFLSQTNVKQQFETMMENHKALDQRGIQPAREIIDFRDNLVMASLQGNWTHRHHPYMSDDRRYQGRGRDEHIEKSRNRPRNNWRDRRDKPTNKRKKNHQRRD